MDACPLTKSSEKGHSTIIEGVEDIKQKEICKKRGGGERGDASTENFKLARRENIGVGAREGGAVF